MAPRGSVFLGLASGLVESMGSWLVLVVTRWVSPLPPQCPWCRLPTLRALPWLGGGSFGALAPCPSASPGI